jgi:hypothetical protein
MGVGRWQRIEGFAVRFLRAALEAACLTGVVLVTGPFLLAEAETVPPKSSGLRVLSESELPDLQLAASDGSWIGQPPMPVPPTAYQSPTLEPLENPTVPVATLLPRTADRLTAVKAGERPQPSTVAALEPETPATLSAQQPGKALSARSAATVLTALSPQTLPRVTGRMVEPESEPEPPADDEPPGLDGEDLARAVQTELKRLNCYKGMIDGDWGGGSQEALSKYYSAAKTEISATKPTEALLKELTGRKDGKLCPDATQRTSVATSNESKSKAGEAKDGKKAEQKTQANKQNDPKKKLNVEIPGGL